MILRDVILRKCWLVLATPDKGIFYVPQVPVPVMLNSVPVEFFFFSKALPIPNSASPISSVT